MTYVMTMDFIQVGIYRCLGVRVSMHNIIWPRTCAILNEVTIKDNMNRTVGRGHTYCPYGQYESRLRTQG